MAAPASLPPLEAPVPPDHMYREPRIDTKYQADIPDLRVDVTKRRQPVPTARSQRNKAQPPPRLAPVDDPTRKRAIARTSFRSDVVKWNLATAEQRLTASQRMVNDVGGKAPGAHGRSLSLALRV